MRLKFAAAMALVVASVCGCACPMHSERVQAFKPGNCVLTEIASSPRRWTGVTVTETGRIFVNYPRWSDDVPVSVAELKSNADGVLEPVAYPSAGWQQWTAGKEARKLFVCVQSVVADGHGSLWVVDAGNPKFEGIVAGGPKLIKIDLATNRVVDTFYVDQSVTTPMGYLNDVRVDYYKNVAYLTDSSPQGAIVVLNLETGHARRLLGMHPSTASEETSIIIDGKAAMIQGKPCNIGSDGIALSTDGKWLYYHPLSGRALYRIQTAYLANEQLPEKDLAKHVEKLGETGPADGLEYDSHGRVFLTELERNAVARFVPHKKGYQQVEILAQDPDLEWPDTFAIGPDGALYVTASQINLGDHPPSPYKLFKLILGTPTRGAAATMPASTEAATEPATMPAK